MDRTTLVTEQRDDGQRLLSELIKNGFDVQAAAWIKTSDDGHWSLFIASRQVDDKGFFTAYRDAQRIIRGMSNLAVGPFDVKLLSASHPLVADVQSMYQRFPAPLQTQFGGSELGKMSIEDALIYPPVSARPARRKSTSSRRSSGKRAVKSER